MIVFVSISPARQVFVSGAARIFEKNQCDDLALPQSKKDDVVLFFFRPPGASMFKNKGGAKLKNISFVWVPNYQHICILE